MKKAILWDLDGTLLYTLPDIAAASNATLRHFGLPERKLEEFYAFVGNGARHQIRSAIGYEPENFEEICAWYKAYYALHSADTSRPYEGIPALTEQLRKEGYLQAIVTNKPHNATLPLWKQWFPEFDLALGESPERPRKPYPDMVDHTLKLLGVEKENAVYVGDSEVDVLTARNAGLPCIALTWGYRSREVLLEAGATHLCQKPEDFMGILEEVFYAK